MVSLIWKIAIIGVPTYGVAWGSDSMVWTIPTLAISSIIAHHWVRVDEDFEDTE